jgi:hypothetical protein
MTTKTKTPKTKTPKTNGKKDAKAAPEATAPEATNPDVTGSAADKAAADPDENMKWMTGRLVFALAAFVALALARALVMVRRHGTDTEPVKSEDPADTLRVV